MANSTAEKLSAEFDLPVAAETTIYRGESVVEMATGGVAPYKPGQCPHCGRDARDKIIGVAQHNAHNFGAVGDVRVRVIKS